MPAIVHSIAASPSLPVTTRSTDHVAPSHWARILSQKAPIPAAVRTGAWLVSQITASAVKWVAITWAGSSLQERK